MQDQKSEHDFNKSEQDTDIKKSKFDEAHDKAWKTLEETGLPLGKMVSIRAAFASMTAEDYPFIKIKHNKTGDINYFSTHDRIKHYMFISEREVILANAIYENTKEDFNANDFTQHFKYTLRLLGVDSTWSK